MAKVSASRVRISGRLEPPSERQGLIDVYVTGASGVEQPVVRLNEQEASWSVEAYFEIFDKPRPLYGGLGEATGKIIAIVKAKSEYGSTGNILMLEQETPCATPTA